MARFPLDVETLPGLGNALARAVDDERARAAFVADPRSYLVAAGVDPKALEGFELDVVADTETKLHFVIPAKIDSARVADRDQDYLEEMGRSVALTCAHMIERRVVPLIRPIGTDVDSPEATGTDG